MKVFVRFWMTSFREHKVPDPYRILKAGKLVPGPMQEMYFGFCLRVGNKTR